MSGRLRSNFVVASGGRSDEGAGGFGGSDEPGIVASDTSGGRRLRSMQLYQDQAADGRASVKVQGVQEVVRDTTEDVNESSAASERKYARLENATCQYPENRYRTRSSQHVLGPDFGSQPRKLTPAKVLLTEESLRANPRMYAVQGRQKAGRKTTSQDYPSSDPPPELNIADVDDHISTPSMAPLFRLYGQSSVKQATLSLAEMADNIKCDDKRMNSTVRIVDEEDESDGSRKIADGDCDADKNGEGSNIVLETERADIGSPPQLDSMSMTAGVIQAGRNQITHNFKQWPLYWDRPIDFQEACEILTHQLTVDPSKICTTVPQNFRGEGTFIIDLRGFSNRHDVSLDGMGMWGKPTGRTRFFSLNETGKPVRIDDGKGKIPYGAVYEYKCMAKRYEHPRTLGGESRFIKKIFTALHPPIRETAVAIAIVCYEWIGEPFDFHIGPGEQIPPKRRSATQAPVDGSKSWEAASFNAPYMAVEPTGTTYFDQCPLYAAGAVDFGTAACIILGGTQIDISRICCRVPQGYRLAGTFVIDVRNFITDAELRRDGNGAWGKPAGHSRYYKLDNLTGDAVRVDRGHKLIEGSDYDVQILSKRYEHTAVNGRFVRKIYTGRSKAGGRMMQCSNLAVITYYWKGKPEDFVATPQRKVHIGRNLCSGRYLQDPVPLQDDIAYYEREEEEEEIDNYGDSQPSTSEAGRGTTVRPGLNPRSGRSYDAYRAGAFRYDQLSNSQLDSLRSIVYRKEYENQERFSAILDRAEAFLERLERASDFITDQVWLAEHSGDQPQQQILLTEDVVLNDGAQFAQDGYSMNVMGNPSS